VRFSAHLAQCIAQLPQCPVSPQALLRAAATVRMPTTGEPVRLRVGIHTGPAMSGVVGTRM
jgi:class 3 adenylate cyclase